MFRPFFRRLSCSRSAVAALLLSAFALSACQGVTIPGLSGKPQATAPSAPVTSEATQPPATMAPTAPPAAPGAPPPAAAATVRVALLLPLSGANAALGNAMVDAAQMALFDVPGDKLELMPHDTQGTAEGAANAARAALGEGCKLTIGPLLAAEVEAAKPVAEGGNVPMLAFSTAVQLAGGGTYLMGFLPRLEIDRVVGFAHAKGANRFAALAPRTPYGEVAVDALRQAVQADGGTLDRVDAFDPQTQDLSSVVKSFAAAGHDFDALLLPEGGAQLKALAPLLPYYDIDPEKVHFLGTGLWDDPTIAGEPEIEGGWYAAPPPGARADFEKRFAALYHHPPPRLATLAYDATALAAVLARGANGPDFSAAALTNPSGFSGIDGIFRFRPDGLIERGLAVLEVHRGGNTVVDPAPDTFQAKTN